jgi:hypothetical protein
MKLWLKYLVVTLVLGIPAFILGPMIWPPTPDAVPTATQLPFFMFLAALEALVFGFGVAFIAFNVKKLRGKDALTKWTFIAISWHLVSWWFHDNLHIHNGMDMQGLLYIDYGFHLTLMASSVVIVAYILKKMSKR